MFRERRTCGEFIAHLARFYLEKSHGRKSVVNNPRRARFVAAYEICLVTGFSVAPSSPPGRKGPFFPFLSATIRRKGGTLEEKKEGERGEENKEKKEMVEVGRVAVESLRFGRSSTIHRRGAAAGEGTRRRDDTAAASMAGPRGVVSLVLRSINTILLSAQPVPCHTALRHAMPCHAVPCRAVPKSVRPSIRPAMANKRVGPLRSVPRSRGPRAAAGPARRPALLHRTVSE